MSCPECQAPFIGDYNSVLLQRDKDGKPVKITEKVIDENGKEQTRKRTVPLWNDGKPQWCQTCLKARLADLDKWCK